MRILNTLNIFILLLKRKVQQINMFICCTTIKIFINNSQIPNSNYLKVFLFCCGNIWKTNWIRNHDLVQWYDIHRIFHLWNNLKLWCVYRFHVWLILKSRLVKLLLSLMGQLSLGPWVKNRRISKMLNLFDTRRVKITIKL